MRLSPRRPNELIAAIVLFMGIGLVSVLSADSVQWRAQVQSMKGPATWSTNGTAVHPLKANALIPAGSTIKTGPESSVDLFLGHSAGVIRLGPDTTFSLDKLNVTDTGADKVVDIQVNLPAGEMFFNVNKLSKASRYEIKIPNGVAGIRGTGGRCHVPPQARIHETEIVLVDGSLAFVWTPPGGGAPVPITMNAPPPVVWRPNEGVRPAPDELVRAVLASINQINRTPTGPLGPPPGIVPIEKPLSPGLPVNR